MQSAEKHNPTFSSGKIIAVFILLKTWLKNFLHIVFYDSNRKNNKQWTINKYLQHLNDKFKVQK